MNEKLNFSEKRDLVIEAGLQLIPYVGGPLCTLYFGGKQEKRFKRIESFYEEFSKEFQQFKDAVPPVEQQNAPALEAIMESLHDKVEGEPTAAKRQFFKNYLKHTLLYPIAGDFDERKYFLDVLDEMTMLDCNILALINKNESVRVGDIGGAGTEQYAIVGSIARMKSYGFLIASQSSFTVGSGWDNSVNENVQMSPFGRRFYAFCLE